MLLAPLSTDVIPLPHQLQTLERVTRGDQVRYLLADEVGLGENDRSGSYHAGIQDPRPCSEGAYRRSKKPCHAMAS